MPALRRRSLPPVFPLGVGTATRRLHQTGRPPFFVDEFTPRKKKLRETDRAIERFVIARDQVYFNLAFFRGDRPGDLGQIKVPGILRFPNDDGFLFNHIWGKMLRDGDENVFGVREMRKPKSVLFEASSVKWR